MTGMEIPAGLRNHAGCTCSKTGFQEISTIHASSSRETASSPKLGHCRFVKPDKYRLDRQTDPKAVVHPAANFASESQNVPGRCATFVNQCQSVLGRYTGRADSETLRYT